MLIIAVSITATIVVAEGEYWLCLTQGQHYPHASTRTCPSDCCTVCAKNNATGQPWWGNWNVCQANGDMCSCDGGPANDFKGPNITLTSPLYNSVWSSRSVRLSLTTDERADYYLLNNNDARRGWTQICKNCINYNRYLSFSEGINNYTLQAVDVNGNPSQVGLLFYIDSQAPRISGTLPVQYGNGNFTIKYDENNVVNVTLHYTVQGQAERIRTRFDCPSGSRQVCDVILPSIQEGTISYYFTLLDKGGSTATSNTLTIVVDRTAPLIQITRMGKECNQPYLCVNTRNYYFNITVPNEQAVALDYMDLADSSPRWNRLCSNCVLFRGSKSFTDGFHDVLIRATDNSGNTNQVNLKFLIDSVLPRIIGTLPTAGTYGNCDFTIVYDEANLVETKLHYKENGVWKEKVKTVCPNGRQICTVSVNPIAEGTITYYFEITDIGGSNVTSRAANITVDTVAPILIVNQPNNQPYDERNVLFDLQVQNELQATLSYVDYADARPANRTLCARCNSYNRTVSFIDGAHDVVIKVVDNAGNFDQQRVQFFVDSMAPRIIGTTPVQGKYTSKDFNISYDEANVEQVIFYYRFPQTNESHELSRTDCPDGRNICSFSLTSSNQKQVVYYFGVRDLATIAYSREITATFDNIRPAMSIVSPTAGSNYNSRSVIFNMSFSENGTLEYKDLRDTSPRFSSLCTRCDKYARLTSLRQGEHEIIFRATDYAGNQKESTVAFTS